MAQKNRLDHRAKIPTIANSLSLPDNITWPDSKRKRFKPSDQIQELKKNAHQRFCGTIGKSRKKPPRRQKRQTEV